MSKALVVGNGESRRLIDIQSLKKDHTVIGCNAIHRDLSVDHLVCCDRRMADEAVKNPNNKDSLIYVRQSWFHYFRKIQKLKNFREVPQLPFTSELKRDQPDHWGSGGYAVLLAASMQFKDIFLLGFDLYPTGKTVNNIYKGTQNYSKPDAQPVDYSYWVYQISLVFKYFPNSHFHILNHPNWEMPKEWQLPNVSFENILSLDLDNKYLSSII